MQNMVHHLLAGQVSPTATDFALSVQIFDKNTVFLPAEDAVMAHSHFQIGFP